MKPPLIITGASGYLGSCLARRFLERGYPVTITLRPTSSTERLRDLLGKLNIYDGSFNSPERPILIHCATDYGRTGSGPAELVEANVVFPLRLIAEVNPRVVINTDTLLPSELSAYALSKAQFRAWLVREDRPIANVAIEHFYGPGDDPTKFVSWLYKKLTTETNSIPLTDGLQERDFVHIHDVVSAFETIVEVGDIFPAGFTTFEVGTGIATSLRQICERLAIEAGADGARLKFGAVARRPNEPTRLRAETSALQRLGWKARYELADGLRDLVESERRKGNSI